MTFSASLCVGLPISASW